MNMTFSGRICITFKKIGPLLSVLAMLKILTFIGNEYKNVHGKSS